MVGAQPCELDHLRGQRVELLNVHLCHLACYNTMLSEIVVYLR